MNLLKNKRRVNFAIISLLLIFSMAGMVSYGIVFNNPKFNIKINKSEDVTVSENGTGTVNINDGDSVNVSYNIEPQKLSIEEKPIDAVVIVDTSQTNSDNIKDVKVAVRNFANDFIKGHNRRLGIVEYNGSASIVRELNSSKYTNIIEEYKKDANHLGTNTGDALRLAKVMLNKERNNNKKVIILMTNGFANVYTGRFFRSEGDYSNIKKDFWDNNYKNNEYIEKHDINKDNIISSFGSSYYHGDIVFDNTGIQYDGVNTYLSEKYFYLGDDEINNRMWSGQREVNENFNESLKEWNNLIGYDDDKKNNLEKYIRKANEIIQGINYYIDTINIDWYAYRYISNKINEANNKINYLNTILKMERINNLSQINYYIKNEDYTYIIDKINKLEKCLNEIYKCTKNSNISIRGNKNLKNYQEFENEKFTETQYFNNILGQIYSCYMAKEVADSGITMYPMFFGDVNEVKNKDLIGLKDGQVKELELNGYKEKVQIQIQEF